MIDNDTRPTLRARLRKWLRFEKPFALEWDAWEQWEADARKAMPIRYWLCETVPLFFGIQRRRFIDACWWIKHRIVPWHRYHVVRTGLAPGYYDKDRLLLHACFNLLVEFIEKEKPFEWFDTVESPHAEKWVEIRALYDWWKVTRPARLDPWANDDGTPPKEWAKEHGQDAMNHDDEFDKEDQAMLHRLIDVRFHLWT